MFRLACYQGGLNYAFCLELLLLILGLIAGIGIVSRPVLVPGARRLRDGNRGNFFRLVSLTRDHSRS